MKTNTVLYISPTKEVENLDEILPTMPGQITHLSYGFISRLTDNQMKRLCEMKIDFKVNEKTARLIHARMETLGIKYDIDHKNKSLKT